VRVVELFQPEQNAVEDTPVTRGQIMDSCTLQFKIKFTRSLGNSFALRHSRDVIQTESAPQEEQRLQRAGAFLERPILDLHEHVQGCLAELVINLHEMGISD
jgi:hypothetical protein